jgi:hypothetical protein
MNGTTPLKFEEPFKHIRPQYARGAHAHGHARAICSRFRRSWPRARWTPMAHGRPSRRQLLQSGMTITGSALNATYLA